MSYMKSVTNLTEVREARLQLRFGKRLERMLDRVFCRYRAQRDERNKLKLLAAALLDPKEYEELAAEIGLNEPSQDEGSKKKPSHLSVVR